MVVIVTNPDKNLVNGDTIVRKHIYCEIVKKGLKPGTFVNMIKRRFTAAQVKNSTWEVADYSKLLEEKKDDHN